MRSKVSMMFYPLKTAWNSRDSNYSSGGGVSESMDGRGGAILALEFVPKNLIFT